jgi:hemoglobin
LDGQYFGLFGCESFGHVGDHGVTMPPRIAVSPEQISLIVADFYTRVRSNPSLGPVFAKHVHDWAVHEERSAGFWRNALLYERSYDGNPMLKHQNAGDVHARHFPIWLEIFDEVLAEHLPQLLAQQWSALAHRIGRGLSFGLQPEVDAGGAPQLRG